MQITILREALLEPLQVVMGAVEKRQTLSILGNVLIKVENNQMVMIATDLEIELHGYSTLDRDFETGSITVPARKLLDITRALPEESVVQLSLSGQILLIQSGASSFKLATLPADDFPHIKEGINQFEFLIPQKTMKFLLEKVYFSMALQDVRYYLNGLFLKKSGQTLRAVATDGHRLSVAEITNDALPEGDSSLIIPRKAIIELMRILNTNDDGVYLSMEENHIKVRGDGFHFVSKLIDGTYPDYNRVIPNDTNLQITVDKSEFKQLLTRVSILSNEKIRGVKLLFQQQCLLVEAHNNENEEAREELLIEYSGEPLEIAFNVSYLLDIINNLPDGPIKIALSARDNSALIQSEKETRCFYVIMSMRI